MKIIGIDPGLSGGITVLVDGDIVECVPMPHTEHDINEVFQRNADADAAFIEYVHSMPKQGVASTFSFGKNYGFLRGMLVANKISFLDITPMKWQRTLGMTSEKGETKTSHKNRLKGFAQQIFPKQTFTLKTADSTLIAYYGYLMTR